jgi:hypothetical protein
MRSPVPTPELIERVMVRDPKAAEILASKPPCWASAMYRGCKNPSKYVMLAPSDGITPIPVCGTHKNERLNVWAWNDRNRQKIEQREQRAKDASYAINLATMLTDARHNTLGIRFSNDDRGNVTLSRDEAQRLLEAWS